MNKKILYIFLILSLFILFSLGFILWSQYSKNRIMDNTVENKRQVVYENYIYDLPSRCRYRENYVENGVQKLNIFYAEKSNWYAVIRLTEKTAFPINDSDFFHKTSEVELYLKDQGLDVYDGQVLKYNSFSYMVFKYHYGDTPSLFAYMPAYDDNLYVIRLTSSIVLDGVEQYNFDYDVLETVVDMLSKGKKVK